MANKYKALSRYSRVAVAVSYGGLLLVLTLNTVVWPSCNRSPNGVILGIQLLLLLVFLPAIIKQSVRTLAWMTFVLLGFFMASVSTAFACTSALTITEVLLTVILFIAAMFYIRWYSRAQNSQFDTDGDEAHTEANSQNSQHLNDQET